MMRASVQNKRPRRRAGRWLAEFHVQDRPALFLQGVRFPADGDGVEGIDRGNHGRVRKGTRQPCRVGGVQHPMNQTILTALQYYGAGAATLADPT